MENKLGFNFRFSSNNHEADESWSDYEWDVFFDVKSVPHVGDTINFDYVFTHLTHSISAIKTAYKYKRFLDDYNCIKFRVVSREYRPIDVSDEKDIKTGLWCSYRLTIEPIEKDADFDIKKYYDSLKHRFDFLGKENK